MRHGKRDGNHKAIVAALRAAGCTVLDLAALGSGAPDILVGFRGRMLLMEIKDPTGRHKVTANQIEFHRKWRGNPIIVVRSVEEALAATGIKTQAGGTQ